MLKPDDGFLEMSKYENKVKESLTITERLNEINRLAKEVNQLLGKEFFTTFKQEEEQ